MSHPIAFNLDAQTVSFLKFHRMKFKLYVYKKNNVKGAISLLKGHSKKKNCILGARLFARHHCRRWNRRPKNKWVIPQWQQGNNLVTVVGGWWAREACGGREALKGVRRLTVSLPRKHAWHFIPFQLMWSRVQDVNPPPAFWWAAPAARTTSCFHSSSWQKKTAWSEGRKSGIHFWAKYGNTWLLGVCSCSDFALFCLNMRWCLFLALGFTCGNDICFSADMKTREPPMGVKQTLSNIW